MNRRSLSVLVVVPILAVAALSVIGGFVASSVLTDARLRSAAEDRATSQLVAIETVASVSDLAGLRRAATAIGASRDIDLVLVAAGDPVVVIAASQTSLTGMRVSELDGELSRVAEGVIRTSVAESALQDGEVLTAAVQLRVRDAMRDGTDLSGAIGVIQVDFSAVVAEAAGDAFLLTLGEVAAVIMLAAVVIWLLRRHVLRPLHSIGHDVNAGEETAPATLTSVEIHELASTPWTALAARAESEAQLADANQQLRELVDSKDEFIASVSHELRTPLSSIVGFADYLNDPDLELSEEERVSFVETISREGADVVDLIDDLLTAARADIDRLEVTTVKVGLLAQARQVIEGLGSRVGDVTSRGDSTSVAGDPRRVRQIVRNLLTNAERYGGPNVSIHVLARGDVGVLQVIDDGDGVPLEDRELVFEPFERAKGGAHVPDSIGVGLPVSRKLAQLMSGDLTYDRVGADSIFELSLPLMVDTGGSETPIPHALDEPVGLQLPSAAPRPTTPRVPLA